MSSVPETGGAVGSTTPATFNLADLFEIVVDAVPEREALVAGDHVAIYAWNRAEWVETWWASYKLRAIPININCRNVGWRTG